MPDQTKFLFKVWQDRYDEEEIKEILNLNYVLDMEPIVTINTEYGKQTKIQIETKETDDFEKLCNYLKTNFKHTWFSY